MPTTQELIAATEAVWESEPRFWDQRAGRTHRGGGTQGR